jgi:NAD(P)-dependent dehydrogenase (short-subunit alcohol dehydrogenase family)
VPANTASQLDSVVLRVAISGATGGIGSAVARRFRQAGAELVLIDLNQGALTALADELGGPVSTIVCDQRVDNAIAAAAAAAGVVDVFVNNAGIIIRKPLLDTSPAEISELMAVNAAGSIKMAIAIARGMAERSHGTIVNVASQHAFIGAANRGVYAATKAAIVQFTRTAAVEWAPLGIRVVGIAPGPVESPMTAEVMQSQAYREAVIERMPIGRFLNTTEIAETIHQLCGPNMAAIVGHTVIADGGGSLS